MRKRLLVALLCGVFGLGYVGMAQAAPGGGSNEGGGPRVGECEDGLDNDGDGLTDADDPACQQPGCDPSSQTPKKCFEATVNPPPPPTSCTDGVDNDGDGTTDSADPECQDPNDGVEDGSDTPPPTSCTDGIDNDGDGTTDSADPECQDPNDGVEDGSDTPPPPTERCVGTEDAGLLTEDSLGETLWDAGLNALNPLTEDPEHNGAISGPLNDALNDTPIEVIGDEVTCVVDLLLDETVFPADL